MNWQRYSERVSVGIDIGWSRTKKSCAVGVDGAKPSLTGKNWKEYARKTLPTLYVGLLTKAELLGAIPELFTCLHSVPTSVVLDGPVGAKGLAMQDRHVDQSFCRGEFNRRMQPSPVNSRDGRIYANTVDEIVRSIHAALQRPYTPAWWDGGDVRDITICETHPTVGLALLLPPQDRDSIASRSRPKVNSDGKAVGQKSDWYWQLGGGRWIADALQSPSVAMERHHERVAGLYCLAVAARLSAFRTIQPTVAAVGNSEGVYVIPAIVDNGWENALRDIGVYLGELSPRDQQKYVAQVEVPQVAVQTPPAVEIDDADDAERGDETWLTLKDNGGFWRKHNDWLELLDSPVCFKTMDVYDELVRIVSAGGDGQWKPENKDQTALKLSQERGFAGKHLSDKNQFRIPIQLVTGDRNS